MPNFVYNTLICKENLLSYILDNEKNVDFGILIPEPKTKKECITLYGVDYLDENDSKHLMHEDGKDWFDWYNWHCDFWGCKWNAGETSVEDENGYYYITFSTAWSQPIEWLNQLNKLGKPFILFWLEEQGYGQLVGYNGKINIAQAWNINERRADLPDEDILDKFFGE